MRVSYILYNLRVKGDIPSFSTHFRYFASLSCWYVGVSRPKLDKTSCLRMSHTLGFLAKQYTIQERNPAFLTTMSAVILPIIGFKWNPL